MSLMLHKWFLLLCLFLSLVLQGCGSDIRNVFKEDVQLAMVELDIQFFESPDGEKRLMPNELAKQITDIATKYSDLNGDEQQLQMLLLELAKVGLEYDLAIMLGDYDASSSASERYSAIKEAISKKIK